MSNNCVSHKIVQLFSRPKKQSRSICICMVKNECYIIEPFLRHNSRFFDEIVVLDHLSTDATAEIVKKCASELGHIHLSSLCEQAFDQSTFMTDALHTSAKLYSPDFVALMDADEFIKCKDRFTFENELRGLPRGGYGEVKWQTYLPAPMEAEPTDPIKRMRFRRREEMPQFTKAVLRLSGMDADDFVVDQGNHGIRRKSGRRVKKKKLKHIVYMHFPVRSRNQMISKCAIGWLGHLMRSNKTKSNAFQWEEIGRCIIEKRIPIENININLSQMALEYAQKSTNAKWPDNTESAIPEIYYERHYSDGKFSDPDLLIKEALSNLPS